MKNRFININISLVRVRRPNFPFNCYTLNLAEQEEVKKEGVKQLFINFWPNKNSSLKILLEDKALACNRTIKYHKFFFSGQSVEITDLGKSNRGFFDCGGGGILGCKDDLVLCRYECPKCDLSAICKSYPQLLAI